MDLGFEGGFVCHRKSMPLHSPYIDSVIDENWVKLKPTRFKLCFANDILRDAQLAWVHYFKNYGYNEQIYHFESIVDLVKKQLTGQDVFPHNVDIVTGGFPCQDFSVAGKRNGFDSQRDHNGQKRTKDEPSEETRGKLYFWMKQVIDIVKPKIFIAENVKGLVSLADVRDIIQHDFETADGNGYIVFSQVLHAGNYGVPESRERIIFIGIRKSELLPQALDALTASKIPQEYNPYPTPTHNYTDKNSRLAPFVTCADIFCNLEEPENSNDLSHRAYSHAKFMGKHCQGQTEIKLDGLAPTIRSEHHGNIEFRRLSQEHGGTHLQELQDGLHERRLSVRECALIQTFPPDYQFVWKGFMKGSLASLNSTGGYRVIGNAVPPVLAYNIAMRIQEVWDKYFEK